MEGKVFELKGILQGLVPIPTVCKLCSLLVYSLARSGYVYRFLRFCCNSPGNLPSGRFLHQQQSHLTLVLSSVLLW